jgi:transcriptional regulator of heat shock response
MSDRSAKILYALVEQYINDARPVGSVHLSEKMSMHISTATIRKVLSDLEEDGYIYQPHTSAGRIPTDKGYRYYVDHMSKKSLSDVKRRQIQDKFSELYNTYQNQSRTAARLLSELVHAVAITSLPQSSDVQEAGMCELLDENDMEAALEVASLLKNIDEYIQHLINKANDNVTVYIGEENPVFSAKHTSLLVKTFNRPDGSQAVLIITGPKRMAYQKNIGLIESVAEAIKQESF